MIKNNPHKAYLLVINRLYFNCFNGHHRRVTRLTESGLSMTDWQLISGAIPPLNEVDWQEAFEEYKQFPEYRK